MKDHFPTVLFLPWNTKAGSPAEINLRKEEQDQLAGAGLASLQMEEIYGMLREAELH